MFVRGMRYGCDKEGRLKSKGPSKDLNKSLAKPRSHEEQSILCTLSHSKYLNDD